MGVVVFPKEMYFPLVFQVISRSCFHFTPARLTVLIGKLLVFILSNVPLLSAIHARGSMQSIHLSGLPSPICVMLND